MYKQVYVLLIALGLNACGLCGEQAGPEEKSPEGEYSATLFKRNCGATTSFVTHINLRKASESFRANSDGTIKEAEVFVVKGQPQIRFAWKDLRSLQIDCVECREDDVFKRESIWKDIQISYKIGN